METLNIYRYRACRKAYDAGEFDVEVQKRLVDLNQLWGDLSRDEQDVVCADNYHTLVLIDVDVNSHPGWPMRVWCRERQRRPVTLRDLTDWTDWDVAAFCLAHSLGILQEYDNFITAKPIFWVSNPLGEGLNEILMHLVSIGILQHREEPDQQFRWNLEYKPLTMKGD